MEQKLVRAEAVPTLEWSASVAALVDAGAQMREPMPLAELERVLGEKNARLAALNEPPLVIAEGTLDCGCTQAPSLSSTTACCAGSTRT